MDDKVSITWLGHSMFLLEGEGLRLVTDPVDLSVGYPVKQLPADVVIVSHGHFDHSNLDLVTGDPAVVDAAGETEVRGMTFTGLTSYHDTSSGRERGENIIFCWELGGIGFAHLGDVGDRPAEEVMKDLGGADVLFVPVGGVFTIDGDAAAELVEELAPRVAIPMHYKTPHCTIDIEPAGKFLGNFQGRVEEHSEVPVTVSKEELPGNTSVWVLPYLK